MFELSINKDEFHTECKSSFKVNVLHYPSKSKFINLDKPNRVVSGELVRVNDNPSNWGTQQVLSSLDSNNTDCIVFSNVNIDRELTKKELYSREALKDWLKSDIKDKEVCIGDTYFQVVLFRQAILLLRDKNKVKGMLPVNVDKIAFIVLDGTEEDFILNMESDFVDKVVAPNGNNFNIYMLKEWC